MKPTLVTGANGHVGYNLTRLLRARGEPVRVMIRATADAKPLEDLGVEIASGDVLARASVEAAVAGCGRVHHVAAGFLMWSKDPEREIVAASRDGTRHVLEAAAAAGVERVLYVSTAGTIGFGTHPGDVRDESSDNTAPHTHYIVGKIAAEKEAFAISARTGMPVVAVNPGLILGPRFFKLSESVRQVADFVNQGMPAYFDGGFGLVDAEDVASGAMLAMEKGRDRERYILSGENLTVKGMVDVLVDLTGLPGPKLKLPVPVLRLVAGGMELVSKVTGARPMLDRSQIDEFAGKYGYLANGKSRRELGCTYRPAREVIRRTVAWLIERGFVAERRRPLLKPHPSLAEGY
jgi:dihydroflavonol-4-reductase